MSTYSGYSLGDALMPVKKQAGLGAGIHEIPVEIYHADPCKEPSISSSGITTLLNLTPAHFAAQHPKLTTFPDLVRTSTKEQDLGTVLHKIILGRGEDYKVITGFDDWRKKEAQQLRDEARGNGYVPILEKTAAEAAAIAEHAVVALKQRFGSWPIGDSEQTIIWQRATGVNEKPQVWCRALADHLSMRACTIVDIKTTGVGLHDNAIVNKLVDGAAVQAAHYLNGIENIDPDNAGTWQFVLFFVETEAPYLCRPITVKGTWRALADQRIDGAVAKFARCLATNEWPGWNADDSLDMPQWAQSRWEMQILMEEAS